MTTTTETKKSLKTSISNMIGKKDTARRAKQTVPEEPMQDRESTIESAPEKKKLSQKISFLRNASRINK